MLMRRLTSIAALIVAEVAALLALHHLGSYEAAAVEWGDLNGWLAQTPPEDALVAVVRSAALVLAWWLTASTVLYGLASATRIPGLVRSVSWATFAPVRRTIDGALATTIVIGSTLGTSGIAVANPTGRAAVVVQLHQEQERDNEPPLPVYRPRPAGDAVQTPYQPTPAGDPPPQPSTLRPTALSTDAQPGPGVDVPPPVPYTVRRGDNLWTIAEQHLAPATGRPVEELHADEVRPYWLRMIDANDDRICSGDPNLIRPGEQIELP